MGRMHWIVATLALGSLALGSFALGSLAAGGSALAGGGAGGEFAPGQQGTSPGKVFHAARASAEQEQRSNHSHLADFQQLWAGEKLGGIGR